MQNKDSQISSTRINKGLKYWCLKIGFIRRASLTNDPEVIFVRQLRFGILRIAFAVPFPFLLYRFGYFGTDYYSSSACFLVFVIFLSCVWNAIFSKILQK